MKKLTIIDCSARSLFLILRCWIIRNCGDNDDIFGSIAKNLIKNENSLPIIYLDLIKKSQSVTGNIDIYYKKKGPSDKQ